ncbi:hypothetical protein [Saccharomonospora cyanea]|uniref:Uncharacterized protein n=1 Tax=Saccharomonospora cyanea NA-134 TaxID=882082 RepID=H5XN69_9PSEU|nr:hypothetical protein [Saccharomonospora cyanea]EHR63702.1 hypothetical protein SaccyDRAFT_4906 [Saccharomonospora cyanea NA-134]
MIDNNDQVVRARIRFDWSMGPFWVQFSGDPMFHDYDTEEILEVLTLSKEILSDIERWDLACRIPSTTKKAETRG